MTEHAEKLKHAFATDLNIASVREALDTWITYVEENLAVKPDHSDLIDRIAALEKAVADLHAALSNAPAPVTVQRAVENVEPPIPAEQVKDFSNPRGETPVSAGNAPRMPGSNQE